MVVITPSQEYNFEDEDQEFISDIFSRISAYEKKKILRRMLRGKMEKAKQGKFFGGKPPYGYTWNESTKEYKIIESEAVVVRLIFNLCIRELSTEKIQEHLNKLSYPTPTDLKGYNHRRKSNKWAKSTVIRILTNSMYSGEFIRWKHKNYDRKVLALRPENEWITAKAPEVISKQVYELAQDALRGRKMLSKRNSKREYLLSGLIHCESCGCKMTGECYTGGRKEKREDRYYTCWNGRRKVLGKECLTRRIKADDIENSVWEEIKRLLKNPVLLKQAIIQSRAADSSGEEVKEFTKQLEEKETEEERILDLYQLGKFDMDRLNSRMERLNKEKEAIRKKIEAHKERNKLETKLKTVNELGLELGADINSFDFEKKRKVLKILLWGKPCVGVFLKPEYSVEIRGLVDFTKLNDIGRIDKSFGIENTS